MNCLVKGCWQPIKGNAIEGHLCRAHFPTGGEGTRVYNTCWRETFWYLHELTASKSEIIDEEIWGPSAARIVAQVTQEVQA